MRGRRGREDWYADADVDRLHIFVPAIMGAGLLISLYTLIRDAVQAHRRHGGGRRAQLSAHATAQHLLTGRPARESLLAGLRPRISYLLFGLASGGLSVYVAIGSTSNFFRAGPLNGQAWLWALSLAGSAGFIAVAAVAAVAYRTWPEPPPWLAVLLVRTPLGQRPSPEYPDAPASTPPLLLGWAAAGIGSAAALLVFVMARAPYVFEAVDDWVNRSAQSWTWTERFAVLDLLGRTHPALVLAALIGLASLRCVPFAMSYLAAVVAGLLVDLGAKVVVSRPRPPNGVLATWTDSFPSGHLVQAVLIAGLVPLALLVFTRRRWVAVAAGLLLSTGVVLTALLRLHRGVHWWTDSIGGMLIGASIVLVAYWALAHRRCHRRCVRCPWAAGTTAAAAPRVPLVRLPANAETGLRWATRAWLLLVLAGFLALAVWVGLPRNPEGEGLAAEVELPVQLSVLALAGLAWLLAWRWEAAAALLLVLVGTLLGVLAAVAYQPLVSGLVAAAFLVPAVGYWLLWQRRRSLHTLVVVALLGVVTVAGSSVGGAAVHHHFYGPAHPASAQQALPLDRVVWSWSGGVTGTGATVVAGLVPDARSARLVLRDPSGAASTSGTVPVPAEQVVRLPVTGLRPDTVYVYAIEVDGVVDSSRGAGRLRTMPVGPSSFTVALGACARTGSNGAVFDAIAGTRPLFYLANGDLHYGNPDRDDVSLFADLYRRTLTAPAQAALYREVPVAYIWDDHDYGPNDADASSPARAAARAAYASMVPHHALPAGVGGAIYQAFSAGRVRFILTDTRSERTPQSMLGARQLAWLEQELVSASRSHALVVWVNPIPWIAPAIPDADHWGAYPAEREQIAGLIAREGIRNLVMLSGDAHMVAIDDGTNTDYSPQGGAGFPLLHAAALDRPGGVKGGPYSEGAYPGGGQFGTLTVRDEGGAHIEVGLAGLNWRGEVLVSYRTTLPVPASVPG